MLEGHEDIHHRIQNCPAWPGKADKIYGDYISHPVFIESIRLKGPG